MEDERVGEISRDGFGDIEVGYSKEGVGVWALAALGTGLNRSSSRNEDLLKLYPTVGPTHVSVPSSKRQYPSVPSRILPAYCPVE